MTIAIFAAVDVLDEPSASATLELELEIDLARGSTPGGGCPGPRAG